MQVSWKANQTPGHPLNMTRTTPKSPRSSLASWLGLWKDLLLAHQVATRKAISRGFALDSSIFLRTLCVDEEGGGVLGRGSGLDEFMSSRRWGSRAGNSDPHYKWRRPGTLLPSYFPSLSPPREDTVGGGHVWARKRVLALFVSYGKAGGRPFLVLTLPGPRPSADGASARLVRKRIVPRGLFLSKLWSRSFCFIHWFNMLYLDSELL